MTEKNTYHWYKYDDLYKNIICVTIMSSIFELKLDISESNAQIKSLFDDFFELQNRIDKLYCEIALLDLLTRHEKYVFENVKNRTSSS